MRVIVRGARSKPRRSRSAISPASILSESRNYPNCVHWHIFYFMWLRSIYEFLCVHSNPIWKGWNCRDYRPSHLTFREYFRPFWFSRSCVEVAYCNRRMQIEKAKRKQGSRKKEDKKIEKQKQLRIKHWPRRRRQKRPKQSTKILTMTSARMRWNSIMK